MILYINTKDHRKVQVSLKKNGKTLVSLSKDREYGSQVLLPLIEKLLKRTISSKNPDVSIHFHPRGASRIWEELEAIEVETGPGSFTGLRVGVSGANALAYSLCIPVNGKKMETKLIY